MTHGQDIDITTSLFNQLAILDRQVPKRNVIVGSGSENCTYVNGVGSSKDCYLIFHTSTAEHCYYANNVNGSSYCVDCYFCEDAQECYECVYVLNGYACMFCAYST